MMSFVQSLDWAVLHWLRAALGCGALDFLMPKITLLGDVGAVWIAAALLMLCGKKYRTCGAAALLSLALCYLVGNLCLKPLIARPRPCWLEPGVKLLVANETDFSFPSGHALSSFAAAAVFAKGNRRFAAPSFALAALIGFSRLYLYVHFPSDVLCGALLGVLIGRLVCALRDRIPMRRKTKGENRR